MEILINRITHTVITCLPGRRTPQERSKFSTAKIIRVNGKNGADALRLAPNSSVLLMDENDPIVWLKVTDGAGYATTTPYSIAPYHTALPVDVNSLEERVKRLEDLINGKSDDANVDGKRGQKAE